MNIVQLSGLMCVAISLLGCAPTQTGWTAERAVPPLGAQPSQRGLAAPQPLNALGENRVSALAEYTLSAVVLGRERYRFDALSDVSPVDLALAWGEAAAPHVRSALSVRQANRWYWWRADPTMTLSPQRVAESTANVHIVPANELVRRAVLALDEGDAIALNGFLVEVVRPDGSVARSSLSRSDVGAGACEIFWVTHIVVLARDGVLAED